MIGYHPQRIVGIVEAVQQFTGSGNECFKEINVVVVMLTLQYSSQALKPHAGIHAGLRQWRQSTVCRSVKLSKYEVPDFNVPVEITIGRTGRASGYAFTMIIEYLRTWTARTRVTHGPEIVIASESGDTILIKADFINPDIFCFVVVNMYGNPQLFRRKFQHLGQKLPGVMNRLSFEVVTKTEVPQHFKESVVPRGVANVIQVVMLATRSYTSLTTCCPCIATSFTECQGFLELHHPRICKQQGRIIVRHQ